MDYRIGIDIGTTTVKVCLMKDLSMTSSAKVVHNAYLKTISQSDTSQKQNISQRNTNDMNDENLNFKEQNPVVLLQALDRCFEELQIPSNVKISSVSVTGQMHGIVCWKKSNVIECDSFPRKHSKDYDGFEKILSSTVSSHTNLITWEDQRCDESFFKSLPVSQFGPVATGFGIPTLLWLLRSDPTFLKCYDMCGTVMDLLVWLLTQTNSVIISSHNANSWGYFDMEKFCWQEEGLQSIKGYLPTIVPIGRPAGTTKYSCQGFTKDVTVIYVALGDMQCSIRACNPMNKEAVLNIGTSSQLSVILSKDSLKEHQELLERFPAVTIVPYTVDHIVLTAASLTGLTYELLDSEVYAYIEGPIARSPSSLCTWDYTWLQSIQLDVFLLEISLTGGNIIRHFSFILRSWMETLGCTNIPDEFSILQKLERLPFSTNNTSTVSDPQKCDSEFSPIMIDPRIFGERHETSACGIVSNITSKNTSLISITSSLYRSIVKNLSSMMPKELLSVWCVNQIVGAGGTLIKNNILQNYVTELFEMPLRLSEESDAAVGAVLLSNDSVDVC